MNFLFPYLKRNPIPPPFQNSNFDPLIVHFIAILVRTHIFSQKKGEFWLTKSGNFFNFEFEEKIQRITTIWAKSHHF
jgi:hypothetical protein